MGVCRLLPHGAYALICAVLSTIAWLSSLFQDGCDFAQLTGNAVALITQNAETPYLDVGFAQYRAPTFVNGGWSISNSGSCQSYPSNLVPMDGHWRGAKGFDFLALVLGGGGTLFLWFSTCFVFSKGTWRWAGYEVLLAAIFQAFAFLWFGTQLCATNTCSLSWGSKADIAACIFWFITAMMIFIRYPSPKDDIDDQADHAAGGGEEAMRDYDETSPHADGGAPTLDAEGNVITPSSDADLSDVPLEGDASATLSAARPKFLDGPTQSMTDAEVV